MAKHDQVREVKYMWRSCRYQCTILFYEIAGGSHISLLQKCTRLMNITYRHAISETNNNVIQKNNKTWTYVLVTLSEVEWNKYLDNFSSQQYKAQENFSCVHKLFPVPLSEFQDSVNYLHCIIAMIYNDVIKWKHFPRHLPFVQEIHRSLVNSSHKGQWRGSLMSSLICAWTNGWVSNRDASDLKYHHANYDVTVLYSAEVLLDTSTNVVAGMD